MDKSKLMMTYEKRKLQCEGCIKGGWEFLLN